MALQRTRIVLLIAVATAVLAAYIIEGAFTRWIADDFCVAATLREQGFFAAQTEMYATWSGRFASTFLAMCLAAAGRTVAPIVPPLAIIAFIAAAWYATASALRGRPRSTAGEVAISLTFVAACIDGAPERYQPVLWTTGLLAYGAPMILDTLAIGLVARGRVLSTLAVTFIAGGMSETALACQLAAAGSLLVIGPRETRRAAIAAVAGSILAAAIVASAPGNRLRREQFKPEPLPAAIASSLAITPATLAATVARAGGHLMLLAIAIFAVAVERGTASRAALLAIFIAAGAIAMTELVAVAGLGIRPPPRAAFLTTSWAAVAVAIVAFAARIPRTRLVDVTLTLAVIAAALLGPLSTVRAKIGAIADARSFARAADDLDATARHSRGAALVVKVPRSFNMLDFVTRNRAHWVNRCVARYYDLGSIVEAPVSPPARRR